MKKTLKNLIYIIILMLIPIPVFSLNYRGSIGIAFKYDENIVSNVNFSLYQLATYDNENKLQIADEFEIYSEDIKNYDDSNISDLTKDLSSYITENNIESYAKKKNGNELLMFENLNNGIYLVIGEALETDEGVYIPQPVLVTIPTIIDGEEKDNIIIEPKCDFRHWIDVSVELKWDDQNNPKRPKEIVIQLVKNGEVVDEATLNEENNWEHHWNHIIEDDYEVVQKKVPNGYTGSITKDGDHFTVIDFYRKEVLPDTGQLWLPVIILISGGVILIIVSLFLKKKEQKEKKN